MDRMEHNVSASFAAILERLDASDSARAQRDAATAAAPAAARDAAPLLLFLFLLLLLQWQRRCGSGALQRAGGDEAH